jgi:pentapeptide MXKDX repeat protein
VLKRRGVRYFDSPRHRRIISHNEEVDMKLFITAALAATLALSGSMAFAQASDAMAHDSMSKDSMSKDSMSKDSMSHDSMKKGDGMKKQDTMGHPASGAMAQ